MFLPLQEGIFRFQPLLLNQDVLATPNIHIEVKQHPWKKLPWKFHPDNQQTFGWSANPQCTPLKIDMVLVHQKNHPDMKRKIIWTKPPWLWVQNVNFPGLYMLNLEDVSCSPSLELTHRPPQAQELQVSFFPNRYESGGTAQGIERARSFAWWV